MAVNYHSCAKVLDDIICPDVFEKLANSYSCSSEGLWVCFTATLGSLLEVIERNLLNYLYSASNEKICSHTEGPLKTPSDRKITNF